MLGKLWLFFVKAKIFEKQLLPLENIPSTARYIFIINWQPRIWIQDFLLLNRLCTTPCYTANIYCMHDKMLQLCPTLCNLMDCSPPGSSVPGILQARILEWVAGPSSRGSFQPRDWTWVSCVSCIGRQVLYH